MAGLLVAGNTGMLLLPSALSILGGLAESIYNLKAAWSCYVLRNFADESLGASFSHSLYADHRFEAEDFAFDVCLGNAGATSWTSRIHISVASDFV